MEQTNRLKVNNTNVILKGENVTGVLSSKAELVTGARLLFTLEVLSIDLGATINVALKNRFSDAIPYTTVENLPLGAVGNISKVLTDVHNIFEFEATVTGGNCTFFLGVSIYDNAVASQVDARIENAELHVDLNHLLQPNGRYDSVRVGGPSGEIDPNADGSINVNIVNTASNEEIKNIYNKITSVADNVRSLVTSFVTDPVKQNFLQFVHVNGNNVANYELEIDGVVSDDLDTAFGGPIDGAFNFSAYSENGFELPLGVTVKIFVTHCRPFVGDFSSRIQYLEIT
jgi:hypothetical protein